MCRMGATVGSAGLRTFFDVFLLFTQVSDEHMSWVAVVRELYRGGRLAWEAGADDHWLQGTSWDGQPLHVCSGVVGA